MATADPLDARNCARYMKALSEADRLRIVGLLQHGSKNVSEIAEELALEQTNASHHLRVLREAELLVSERQGKYVVYRLNPEICRHGGDLPADVLEFGCCRIHLGPFL